MRAFAPSGPARLAAGLALACCLGCGTKNLSELAGDAKKAATDAAGQAGEAAKGLTQSAQKVTTKAAETMELAGSMELTLDQPYKTSACYVKFMAFKSGRPSILQLQSYREAGQEGFPSAFVRAEVSAGTLAELVGQTVGAQAFVQPQADGPTWAPQPALVQLKILAVDAKTLTAEIVGGALVHSGTAAAQPVKGVLKGVL